MPSPLEHGLQFRRVERALAGLVDHDLAVERREFVDDVVPVLTADQDPAERALVTDPLGGLAALQLRGRAVREIRQVALSGVHDEHAGRAGGGEQLGQRRHHLLQQTHVVAQGLTEPAGQQEVPLHVDDEEGDPALREWERSRRGVDRPFVDGCRSCQLAFGSGERDRRGGLRWSCGGSDLVARREVGAPAAGRGDVAGCPRSRTTAGSATKPSRVPPSARVTRPSATAGAARDRMAGNDSDGTDHRSTAIDPPPDALRDQRRHLGARSGHQQPVGGRGRVGTEQDAAAVGQVGGARLPAQMVADDDQDGRCDPGTDTVGGRRCRDCAGPAGERGRHGEHAVVARGPGRAPSARTAARPRSRRPGPPRRTDRAGCRSACSGPSFVFVPIGSARTSSTAEGGADRRQHEHVHPLPQRGDARSAARRADARPRTHRPR